MKNKIIALMALVPLIIMFTVMTLTEAASVRVQIPVSGVEITTPTLNVLFFAMSFIIPFSCFVFLLTHHYTLSAPLVLLSRPKESGKPKIDYPVLVNNC